MGMVLGRSFLLQKTLPPRRMQNLINSKHNRALAHVGIPMMWLPAHPARADTLLINTVSP